MYHDRPDEELQELLDLHAETWLRFGPALDDQTELGDSETAYISAPAYVIGDAVERLKRYETIVNNLIAVGNFLWIENLKARGYENVQKNDTPLGSYKDKTYIGTCSFVENMRGEITIEDVFVELTSAMSRVYTQDPSGLSQYQYKEEKLFEQLEYGDSDG